MGLVKRTYVDGETVITAENLNAIQDAIIENEEAIETKGTYSKPSGGIPKTDLASSVQESLDAADTAYQKPSGGIPKTDLASAVQTSLGKADTALQSSDIDNTLSVTGKSADAKKTGDEISDLKNTLNQLVRPNLLDNWYFAGGGSNNNTGVFPINQRGQNSYSGSAYYIDRWRSYEAANEFSVDVNYNDRVDFTKQISQVIESGQRKLAGKTVTISALFPSGDLLTATGTLPNSFTPSTTYLRTYKDNFCEVILYCGASGDILFIVNTIGTNVGSWTGISAVKLELGSGQTLAHQENGVWVLNEIPNYGEELAKCQRYYCRIPQYIHFLKAYEDTTNTDVIVNVPVPMSGYPSVSGAISGLAISACVSDPFNTTALRFRLNGITPYPVPSVTTTLEISADL